MPFGDGNVEALLWCMRPTLDLYHLRQPLPESIRSTPVTERGFRPADHAKFGRFLVVTETANQWRALERLISSATHPIDVPVLPPEDRAAIFADLHINETIDRMATALGDRVTAEVRDSLENQLYKVALALNNARNTDLRTYAGVLVSTQHSPIIRALIRAAGEQSVPVVYVPHAPVANNGAYWDLPVQYAGLRGDGERQYYADELTLDASRLDAVGNLATDVLTSAMPRLDVGAAGVVAVSPHSTSVLRQVFDTIGDTGLGPMIVAPHPRSDLDELRTIVPPNWHIHTGGRTLDLLTSGVPFLFQFSSGVAWESAALGIPTATIRIDDSEVNYPFLDNERIYPSIRSPEAAQAFAQSARADQFDRNALRAHAEYWCSSDADLAARALFDLLDQVAAENPSTAHTTQIHDGWGAGGTALERSWMSGTSAAPLH